MKKDTRVDHLKIEVMFIIQDLFRYKSDRVLTFSNVITHGGEIEFHHEYVIASALIMYDLVQYENMTENSAMEYVRQLSRDNPYRNRSDTKQEVIQKDESVKYGTLIRGDDIRDVCHASSTLACYNHLCDYLESHPHLKPVAPRILPGQLYQDEDDDEM